MRNALAVLALGMLVCSGASANKPLATVEKTSVGNAVKLQVVPALRPSRHSGEKRVWEERIHFEGATFVKAHLAGVKLRGGDRLVLTNAKGRVVETITGRGPKERGDFWALSAQGDTLHLRLEYVNDYSEPPFRIDSAIAGDTDLFAPRGAPQDRSICFPPDFEDAICSIGDPDRWASVRASVGVMTLGSNAATGLWCSGSNVSPGNAVLTNQHCIENQAVCDNAEFVFEHYRTVCGDTGSALSQWQSFRCDEVLASQPLQDCDASPGTLDFTLASVIGDPATDYGHVRVDPTPLNSGEGLYIVQHPAGRPHEISSGGGADVVVDGSVLRYYNTLDTEGGSSGSPIFRAADHKLVGLHHCGGCDTAGLGNRGMLMSDIYPLISPHLCTEAADLVVTGANSPVEVSGNGDASIDPGEQWSFSLNVLNNACSLPASGISAQVSVSAGDATLAATTVSVADLAASTAGASTPVVFTLPTSHVCGSDIQFSVDSVSNGAGDNFAGAPNVLTVTSGQQIQTDLLVETFDGGLGAWTVIDGGTGSGPAATWTTGNPGGRSLSFIAPYAIVDSDELGTSAQMDETLTGPVLDTVPYGEVFLRYSHDYNWYSGGQAEVGDVEVRSLATLGAWVNLVSYQGGDSSGTVTHDITPYSGPDLQVRFRYYNASYEWWWALDDITVYGLDPSACTVFGADADGDGIADDADNCTLAANPDQRDTNGDGYGNACDADLNNDGVINPVDLGLLRLVFFSADADADFNGDGVVNPVDLGLMRSSFFGAPGPSGVAP